MSNYKLVRKNAGTPVHKALDHENDFIKQWAKEDWEVGKPFSPDDFDYFRRLAKEDGYEVDEDDFAKYFEYYDEFRDAQFAEDLLTETDENFANDLKALDMSRAEIVKEIINLPEDAVRTDMSEDAELFLESRLLDVLSRDTDRMERFIVRDVGEHMDPILGRNQAVAWNKIAKEYNLRNFTEMKKIVEQSVEDNSVDSDFIPKDHSKYDEIVSKYETVTREALMKVINDWYDKASPKELFEVLVQRYKATDEEEALSTEEFLEWHENSDNWNTQKEVFGKVYAILEKNPEYEFVDEAYENLSLEDRIRVTVLIKSTKQDDDE